MKRHIIAAALTLVVGAVCFPTTAGAQRKAAKKAKTEQPAPLATASDTLSYVAGISITHGLQEYLQQAHGLDATLMDDFLRGFQEASANADDPHRKAYLVGMDIAKQVAERMLPQMQREFTDTPDTIIAASLFRGFADALKGDTTFFTTDEADSLFFELQQSNRAVKDEKLYGENRDAGRRFLAENAQKDSVVTLPSGLQYKVIRQGDGPVPGVNDLVSVNYEGRLIDGTVFDSSYERGEPTQFSPAQVIKGWTEALTSMPVGSKWQLFIPFELAYGSREGGPIPPYSALIFDVELLSIDQNPTE